MQITTRSNKAGQPIGYTMWLSSTETYDWAHRADAAWPCSTIDGKRIKIIVDGNGPYDVTIAGVDGDDIDGGELRAIIADHLPVNCRHLWPVWAATPAPVSD